MRFEIDKIHALYQFENFEADDKNKVALNLFKKIALGVKQLPLEMIFVYGKTGTGKTHLVEALANEINGNFIRKHFVFVRSETFVRNFISAVRNNNIDDLFKFYLKYDVLIVDDIHCFEQKEKTQEYLIKLLEYCSAKNKLVILTSSISLYNLKSFDEKLTSMISKSLFILLDKPSYNSKQKILKNYIVKYNINISNDILDELANNEDASVRELQGSIITLIATASALNEEITLDFFKQAFMKNRS